MPLNSGLLATQRRYFEDRAGSRRTGRDAEILRTRERELQGEERAQIARNTDFVQQIDGRLAYVPRLVSWGVLTPAPFSLAAVRAVQNPQWVSRNDTVARDHVTCLIGRATRQVFQTLGAGLLGGRTFTEEDVAVERANQQAIRAGAAQLPGQSSRYSGVAVVNETLAARLWPGRTPIGKQFRDRSLTVRTVVGMVADFHQTGYAGAIMPAAYYPFTEAAAVSVVARCGGNTTAQCGPDVARSLRGLVPPGGDLQVRDMRNVSDAPVRNLRFALILLTSFSLLGTIVAGLGVYAAAALAVAGRRTEIAVRLALGAVPRDIRLLAVRRLMWIVTAAVPTAVLAGWVTAKQLTAFLFQVRASDIGVYTGAVIFTLVVVIAAGLQPALRAAAVDPATALRCD
jgi:hypothetical protein